PVIPLGINSGLSNIGYNYSTNSIDPDGDQIAYTFDWGDGTNSTTDPIDSGAVANATHIWNISGTYQVRAMATDSKGASSDWSDPLAVNITYGKTYIGFFRPSTARWYQDYDNNGQSDYQVRWGASTDMPIAGDWDGDVLDEIGFFRPSTARWYLDYDNNGMSDYQVRWGASTDKPIAGCWTVGTVSPYLASGQMANSSDDAETPPLGGRNDTIDDLETPALTAPIDPLNEVETPPLRGQIDAIADVETPTLTEPIDPLNEIETLPTSVQDDTSDDVETLSLSEQGSDLFDASVGRSEDSIHNYLADKRNKLKAMIEQRREMLFDKAGS
ncbi:PKD domain-containing protein, partial [archaeon]|nr:PKD domain-containing protein [archaeon]